MDELNKTLAEWAGFKDAQIDDLGHAIYRKDCVRTGANWEWARIPNFTKSLDACFKWLVPELDKRGIEIRMYHSPYTTRTSFVLRKPEEPIPNFDWGDEYLALALCLAIEKLIDGEVKQ